MPRCRECQGLPDVLGGETPRHERPSDATALPASHHFHRRRPPLAEREIAALAESGLRHLERHLLPAGDPSDPRGLA